MSGELTCNCDAVVGHHNGCAIRFTALPKDHQDATLTREAVAWFVQIAEEAVRDIAALPEGSQPLWFRARAVTVRGGE